MPTVLLHVSPFVLRLLHELAVLHRILIRYTDDHVSTSHNFLSPPTSPERLGGKELTIQNTLLNQLLRLRAPLDMLLQAISPHMLL